MSPAANRTSPPRSATYEDVLAAPETMIAEILDGELILSPRPAPPHAVSSSAMGADLHVLFGKRRSGGGPGGWWILDEPELHLGRHVMVPDLAGWRRERLPVMPQAAFFELPPDWVCEVLSPSTGARDRLIKMRIYAAHRVTHVWLVDPLERLLEIYRRQEENWLRVAVFSGSMAVRAEPFDAVELDLDDWWLPGEEGAASTP
jgi:Uma2 family endonuclease